MHTRHIGYMISLVAALALSPMASASDGKAVFESTCAACHGAKGQGTPGMAPALKGDPFVIKSRIADIENTIQNGRSGDKKKYKDIHMDMPAWHLPEADLKAVVAYLRGDLQKP
ncbi:MAG TPA: cytochrome c [Gammaproteobacteria bacterium]|nr:cytochrome c [Gammaproteobacteria bacterium]